MKKSYLASMLCMASLLTASSAAAAMPEKTFTQASGLALSYSGQPMLGKSVTFTPDAADASKGTLTLKSTFNLAAIPDVPDALKKELPGPGVIPGSPVLTLPVTLVEEAGVYSFSGKGQNDYLTFDFSGRMAEDKLELAISGASLLDKRLAGSWEVCGHVVDEWGDMLSTPVNVVWTSPEMIQLGEEFGMPVETILNLVLVMPIINGDSSVVTLLPQVFRKATFLEDGNFTADVVAEGKPVTSPLNMVQYVVRDDKSMLVYLDPAAIAAFDAILDKEDKTRAGMADLDLDNILGNVMAQVAPMLSQGVPLGYRLEDGHLTLFIGQDVILPILKNNVLPLLKDEQLVKELAGMLENSGDETMASMAQMIPGVASSLVKIIETTTEIEIGINFQAPGSGVEGIAAEPSAERAVSALYDIAGNAVDESYRGLVIVRYNDGSAAKIMRR